jgi:sugar lactone lactonase YvrE
LFTGATGAQAIRLWDIRANTAVYKLSTGNNWVNSLHWDHDRNYLWAATTADCKEHGFRRLRDDENGDDMWDGEPLWPKKAFHREDYFGEMFNANGHLLCKKWFLLSCARSRLKLRTDRYVFKEHPGPNILPEKDDTREESLYDDYDDDEYSY